MDKGVERIAVFVDDASMHRLIYHQLLVTKCDHASYSCCTRERYDS